MPPSPRADRADRAVAASAPGASLDRARPGAGVPRRRPRAAGTDAPAGRVASTRRRRATPISGEVLGWVLARRIASLQDDPRTTLFFGRIDVDPHDGPAEQFHIGRRHVPDEAGDPVVVDWRAPISTAFYRASPREPHGRRAAPAVRRRPRRAHRARGRAPARAGAGRGDGAARSSPPRSSGRASARCATSSRRSSPSRTRSSAATSPSASASRARRAPARRRSACTARPGCSTPHRERLDRSGRARRRTQPRLPRPHRRRAALARRGAGRPRHHRDPARPHGRVRAERARRRRHAQGRRAARRGAAPRRLVAASARPTEALVVPRGVAKLAGAGIRGRATIVDELRRRDVRYSGRARTCCPSGSRTTCSSRWSAPATRPDDRVQDAVARSPRPSRRTSRGLAGPRPGAAAAPPAVRRRRLADRRRRTSSTDDEQSTAAVGQARSHQGRARWSRADMALLDEIATCSARTRASGTSCSTRPRTSRPCSCAPSAGAARPGR